MIIKEQRQQRRIERHLSVHFCLRDAFPVKWDLSVTQNISVGGVRFTGSNDFQTINKTIRLKIKIPELSLPYLELEADVLSAQPRFNGRTVDIRAKFINISEAVKKELSVLENSANFQMA